MVEKYRMFNIFFRKRIKLWFYRFFHLLLLTTVVFLAQEFAIKFVGPPSRRIANMPYILEMISVPFTFILFLLFGTVRSHSTVFKLNFEA